MFAKPAAVVLAAFTVAVLPVGSASGASPTPSGPHTCPADLTSWRQILGADWLDCHQLTTDSWDGHLLTAGTPGIRDAFSSDFILSDYALEKGWAYVSLPIKTDSDLYAQMVQLAGHGSRFRYYVVAGGNHVDPQFDDHYGVDAYGTNVLRPILPCARAAIDALAAWVEQGSALPPSHTIARPAGASASALANSCSLG